MTFEWEKYREEICDLYITKDMSMQRVMAVMRDKYRFGPCERVYREKIKEWGAQKHAPARQAWRALRQSIDSGYQSQSTRSCSSTLSHISQRTDDAGSEWEASATSNEPTNRSGFTHLTKPYGDFQPRVEPGPKRPCFFVSSAADDLPIDTALSQPVLQQCSRSRKCSKAVLLGAGQAVSPHQNLATKPPSSLSGQCGSRKRLSSGIIDFCAPHALPSQCSFAHFDLEQPGLPRGLISCQHCDATKLHCLASVARTIEPWCFANLLRLYLPIVGATDKYGNTCVHFAAGSGASLAHLEALAREMAPMMHTNNAGQTCLHVLNVKLYDRGTLRPIIQWALRTDGAMAKQDVRKRTVWHSIFQRGISREVFDVILPELSCSKDDMMILDEDNHTPLDCIRSYWTSTKQTEAVDYLNMLQSSQTLPMYFAVNQTAPVSNTVYTRAPSRLPVSPGLSTDVSRLAVPSTGQYDSNDSMRHGLDELLFTYRNGGVLECTNIIPLESSSNQPVSPARPGPWTARIPEKARRVRRRT